jgi:RNA polymerase sigma-70 factor, ECF subfamily
MRSAPAPNIASPSGEVEHIRRTLGRDDAAFRTIMERHNRCLYRIARGILRNESEAEDAVQEAYVKAFTHLGDFRGDSRLATWLSRITMNEALGRLRRQRPAVDLESFEARRSEAEIIKFPQTQTTDPERIMAQREILQLSKADFDKAYVTNEVAYHKTVNGALATTLIPSASNPELKSLLQTGLKIFQCHEQHAEKVAATLK